MAIEITIHAKPNLISFEGGGLTAEERRAAWEAAVNSAIEAAGYTADIKRGYEKDHYADHLGFTLSADALPDEDGEAETMEAYAWGRPGHWACHPVSELSDFEEATGLAHADVVAALDRAYAAWESAKAAGAEAIDAVEAEAAKEEVEA